MKFMSYFPFSRKHLILIILILFLFMSMLSYVVLATESKFFDKSEDSFTIQAGTWWDGSDLSYIQDPEQDTNACPTLFISFHLENGGFTMLDTTTYQLYYSAEGDPLEGEIVKEGTLPIISENETYTLDVEVDSEGIYQLKVDQRPMYLDDEEKPHSIWSEHITVICIEEEEEMETEEIESEENNKQSEPQEKEVIIEKEEIIEEEKEPSVNEKEEVEIEDEQQNEKNDEKPKEAPIKEEDKQVKEETTESESTEKDKKQTDKEGEQDGVTNPEGTEQQEADIEKNKESDQ
ncbi:amyloid fiber anchoring/assembly protein TapA [Gracilibacillus massiliensis]|uniref:amyloid fiber anchoring/assembly protein TapA n=1 Tax=Gracilibacillus massiliensis TaxID=1564956 RepID=UPI00071D7DF5|nr:amyloid fiber anchoring/assembly protein TapA [Gracilibacillus massiliensis]